MWGCSAILWEMAIPDSAELLTQLQNGNVKDVVRKYIIEGESFIFQKFPEDEEPFYKFLHSNLSISREGVIIVGSAKLGYSCAPYKYGREFNQRSDIDVAIIDQELFDKYWHCLLDWTYMKRGTIEKYEKDKIKEYRNSVMKGFVSPDLIYPRDMPREDFNEMQFKLKWQKALKGLSSLEGTSEIHLHDVKARLYRTKEHALLYHFDGMRTILDERLK